MKALEPFDIYVAHNGQFFDKTILTAWALKFGMTPWLRFQKFIDPVMLARRHMRISRRSLHSLIQFFDIPQQKTEILWSHWMKAAFNGDKKSMNYIVDHCVADVAALEQVYDRMRKLVKEVNERGSGQ